MEHWNDTDPLSRYIGNDSVKVMNAERDEHGNVTAVLQGERFEKQIHTCMPDGQPAADRQYPILPPTPLQYPEFLQACTACGKCMEVCPEHILKPATHEYEVYGIRNAAGKPTISFESGYCRDNCQRCVEVCQLLKKTRRLGWAQFNSRTCITQTEQVPCDACARHCRTKAIVMVQHNGMPAPSINPRLCIGCGACEFYCPARPKAIYVEGD